MMDWMILWLEFEFGGAVADTGTLHAIVITRREENNKLREIIKSIGGKSIEKLKVLAGNQLHEKTRARLATGIRLRSGENSFLNIYMFY